VSPRLLQSGRDHRGTDPDQQRFLLPLTRVARRDGKGRDHTQAHPALPTPEQLRGSASAPPVGLTHRPTGRSRLVADASAGVAVALDQIGRRLGTLAAPRRQLATHPWKRGPPVSAPSSRWVWKAPLLRCRPVQVVATTRPRCVVELNRPDRQTRRSRGKCDVVDAEADARAIQAGTATATPKSGDGAVEMIRGPAGRPTQCDEGTHASRQPAQSPDRHLS
jgi:hypothetical protein